MPKLVFHPKNSWNWRFLKVFNGSYIILHSDDWLFTLFGGVTVSTTLWSVIWGNIPEGLTSPVTVVSGSPASTVILGRAIWFFDMAFFFGKNWSLDFWGYPCCIFFGTIKGCSLLIECEAILADLFLREGKYQWCGPTKVIKPRCTCLIRLSQKNNAFTIQILGDTWNELSRSVSLSQHFQTKSVHHLRSPFYITSPQTNGFVWK